MNIPRMFAHAIVRRIAYVVVGLGALLLASLFGASDAHAQSCPPALSDPSTPLQVVDTHPSRGEAYAHCLMLNASLPRWRAGSNYYGIEKGCAVVDNYYATQYDRLVINNGCEQENVIRTLSGSRHSWVEECPEGGAWNEETKSCYTCDVNGPPLGHGHVQCSGAGWDGCPYTVCDSGCGYDQPGGGLDGYVIDGTRWVLTTGWMPRGETCTVGSTPGLGTPPPDSDGDGTSDSNDTAPNNPGSGGGGDENGEGQDEDGSSACGGPGQPACEEDGSNEGSGKGNTSGGGGNCQTPPSSTGDAILAQIAYQAWATRCAVEGLGQGGSGIGPGEGDGDQPDWTEGNGPPNPEDTSAQDIEDASDWGIGLSADLLNTENIFGNASCPALPSFSIMGYEIDTSAFSWWCTLISIMRAAILIMGAFTAIQILLRGF